MKFKNLTGLVFGQLTVIRPDGKDNHSRYYWLCECSCGNNARIKSGNLTSGNSKSCGCSKTVLDKRATDMTGKVFSDLTVIERDYSRNPKNGTFWLCKCSCGELLTVARRKLVRGESTKCRVKGRHATSESARHALWADAVKERDGHACRKCHSVNNLHAHHILSFTRYPELRDSLDNGCCLCISCHKEFHKSFGVMKNTEQEFYDWLLISADQRKA